MWNFPLFPEQASTTAERVDWVFFYSLALLVFFTVLLAGLIIGLAVRYRQGSKVVRTKPMTHNTLLEAAWILIPLAPLLILFAAGSYVYFEVYDVPGDASEISVVGKQWMWYTQHPEGRREINELHVPIGRAVKLSMTSQDTIHSFYVPNFRVKQDVLPGRETVLWFRPTKLGRHHLFCAEYCGTKHSAMGGWIVVMEPAEYEKWLKEGPAQPSMDSAGAALFITKGCSGCHGTNSEFHAPKLTGVYNSQQPVFNDYKDKNAGSHFQDADDRYMRDSILLPKQDIVAGYEPIMPSYQGILSEDELIQILAYLKSIGQGSNPR